MANISTPLTTPFFFSNVAQSLIKDENPNPSTSLSTIFSNRQNSGNTIASQNNPQSTFEQMVQKYLTQNPSSGDAPSNPAKLSTLPKATVVNPSLPIDVATSSQPMSDLFTEQLMQQLSSAFNYLSGINSTSHPLAEKSNEDGISSDNSQSNISRNSQSLVKDENPNPSTSLSTIFSNRQNSGNTISSQNPSSGDAPSNRDQFEIQNPSSPAKLSALPKATVVNPSLPIDVATSSQPMNDLFTEQLTQQLSSAFNDLSGINSTSHPLAEKSNEDGISSDNSQSNISRNSQSLVKDENPNPSTSLSTIFSNRQNSGNTISSQNPSSGDAPSNRDQFEIQNPSSPAKLSALPKATVVNPSLPIDVATSSQPMNDLFTEQLTQQLSSAFNDLSGINSTSHPLAEKSNEDGISSDNSQSNISRNSQSLVKDENPNPSTSLSTIFSNRQNSGNTISSQNPSSGDAPSNRDQFEIQNPSSPAKLSALPKATVVNPSLPIDVATSSQPMNDLFTEQLTQQLSSAFNDLSGINSTSHPLAEKSNEDGISSDNSQSNISRNSQSLVKDENPNPSTSLSTIFSNRQNSGNTISSQNPSSGDAPSNRDQFEIQNPSSPAKLSALPKATVVNPSLPIDVATSSQPMSDLFTEQLTQQLSSAFNDLSGINSTSHPLAEKSNEDGISSDNSQSNISRNSQSLVKDENPNPSTSLSTIFSNRQNSGNTISSQNPSSGDAPSNRDQFEIQNPSSPAKLSALPKATVVNPSLPIDVATSSQPMSDLFTEQLTQQLSSAFNDLSGINSTSHPLAEKSNEDGISSDNSQSNISRNSQVEMNSSLLDSIFNQNQPELIPQKVSFNSDEKNTINNSSQLNSNDLELKTFNQKNEKQLPQSHLDELISFLPVGLIPPVISNVNPSNVISSNGQKTSQGIESFNDGQYLQTLISHPSNLIQNSNNISELKTPSNQESLNDSIVQLPVKSITPSSKGEFSNTVTKLPVSSELTSSIDSFTRVLNTKDSDIDTVKKLITESKDIVFANLSTNKISDDIEAPIFKFNGNSAENPSLIDTNLIQKIHTRSNVSDFIPSVNESIAPNASTINPPKVLESNFSTNISTPFQSVDWAPAIAQRVTWMVTDQLQNATLTVNPEHLGPIEVKMQTNANQQTSVQFFSNNPEVRQAIQDGIPALREMMQQNGLQLGQADVGARQQPSSNQNSNDKNSKSNQFNSQFSILEATEIDSSHGIGLINTYA